MAERPEDLNLPITVVQRLIKEAVRRVSSFGFNIKLILINFLFSC